MAVSRDDVRHIAGLARIGVPEDRLDALVNELSGILGHMDVLARVDTSGLGPGPVEAMPLAPDEPPSVGLDRTREDFAPSTRDGFFLVPRLSTHEDGEESA
jgi:aspartyl-tRNA(Asn)/glutamyl-tRNA(Gln) amidotransferase subunit C